MNRIVKYIVVHSTKTLPGEGLGEVRSNMRAQGNVRQFHCLVDCYGHAARVLGANLTAQNGAPENESCYHLAYIGGLTDHRTSGDTRTPVQTHVLYEKILELQQLCPGAQVIGADVLTGDPSQCPGFDVSEWMNYYKDHREDWIDYEEPETEEAECYLQN